MPMLQLLRPHQYTKNLLVFAAPGAAGRLDEGDIVIRTTMAFVLFCAASSAGYVANDVADVEADRAHPKKRHRPIASGAVSRLAANTLIIGLSGFAIGGALVLPGRFGAILVGYMALTFAYSSALKRIPWVELIAVSAGFLLRAVAGGVATSTSLSGWFLVVVSAGALLVITGKRLGEMLTLGSTTPTRQVLARYRVATLRGLTVAAAALAIAGYATWAVNEAADRSADDSGTLFLQLTIAPFLVAIGRYLMLSWRGRGEAPDLLVLRDPVVITAGIGWVALYAIGLYR